MYKLLLGLLAMLVCLLGPLQQVTAGKASMLNDRPPKHVEERVEALNQKMDELEKIFAERDRHKCDHARKLFQESIGDIAFVMKEIDKEAATAKQENEKEALRSLRKFFEIYESVVVNWRHDVTVSFCKHS